MGLHLHPTCLCHHVGVSRARKRHHYVPAFYLRRFADASGRLDAYRRTDQRHVTRMPVCNAAVESGLYLVEDEEGAVSDAAEVVISDIEGQVAPALDELVSGPWPPDHEARGLVANLLALQVMRTREMLHTLRALADHARKWEMSFLTRDQLRQLIIDVEGTEPTEAELDETVDAIQDFDSYQIEVHPNLVVRSMLQAASEFVQPIADRSWFLQVSEEPLFLTTDAPVVMFSPSDGSGPGAGVLTAAEIWFPVDPHHSLLLVADDKGWPESRVPVPNSLALQVSHDLAQSSYEWVFACPDSDVLNILDLPAGARPLAYIGGEPLWRPDQAPPSDHLD
jgi:hypothetical protein